MKSQAFSMDIMIAIVIFIGTIFVFYSFLSGNQESKAKELQDDASKVLKNIAAEDSDVGIVDGVEIDKVKFEELLGMEYSEIKRKIRIKNDFCFFLEDENGNVIYISQDQPGVGSSDIKIGGEPCG